MKSISYFSKFKNPFIGIVLIVITTFNFCSCTKSCFYIGTYTSKDSKGIYKSNFNSFSGKMSQPLLVAQCNNPSFQSISDDNKILWTVNESWDKQGTVISYSIDRNSGNLKKIEEMSSEGSGPCYIDYYQQSDNVVVANYGSGNITAIPTNGKGKLAGKFATHQHTGSGPNTLRQQEPHAHCAKVDPNGKYFYSCDLGTDEIYVYLIDKDSLLIHKTIKAEPGSGPRHIAFNIRHETMSVINELNGTISTYKKDQEGCYSEYLNTVTALPVDFKGENKSADIHYSSDGQFLYASNRGPDNIAIFKTESLNPEFVEWENSNIKTPRNFTIDPSGKYLLVANQDDNSIVVFKIDRKNGKLKFTGNKINVSLPVCLTFLN
ncbi:MAG: lactonase family protein [Prolixibacteraceae bacterium]|nr:lactonase family protein [Prolixibacteraceae bacterium]